MKIRNIVLIGTSHIAKSSIKEIKTAFKEEEPDLVAIELDPARMQALAMDAQSSKNPKLIFQIGLTGYLFLIIGAWLQKKMGKLVGVVPGSEMLTAMKEAKKREKPIYLIDQNVQVILKNLSKEVSFREKLRLFFEIFTAPFRKGEMKRIDLNKVPEEEMIEMMKKELKGKFPGLHKVLVGDRNTLMAKRILKLERQNPEKKILVVVGAGHLKEIVEIIRSN